MKRIRPNNSQKKCIEKWLEDSNDAACPFWDFFKCNQGSSHGIWAICRSWFPKIKDGACPCDLYEFKTVFSRAKQMLKYGRN